MNRLTLLAANLALAGLAVAGLAWADGPAARVAPNKKKERDRVVVVDPLEFRQPVPNPELGLSDKYNGKPVRFKGVLADIGIEPNTKRPVYILEVQITYPNARPSDPKETVRVTVNLQADTKRLGFKPGTTVLTVEGTGDVQTDGSLAIHGGQVVGADPLGR